MAWRDAHSRRVSLIFGSSKDNKTLTILIIHRWKCSKNRRREMYCSVRCLYAQQQYKMQPKSTHCLLSDIKSMCLYFMWRLEATACSFCSFLFWYSICLWNCIENNTSSTSPNIQSCVICNPAEPVHVVWSKPFYFVACRTNQFKECWFYIHFFPSLIFATLFLDSHYILNWERLFLKIGVRYRFWCSL